MMHMEKQDAIDFFSTLYRGEHHIPAGGIKPFGQGWSVNHYSSLATFDFDELTRLVFLAHDRAVRVEIMQGGPRAVKIAIFQRQRTGDNAWQRHPTIDEALTMWRAGQKPTY